MSEYAILKLVHLGALVFWLGPALGAWFVLKTVDRGDTRVDASVSKVNRVFFQMIVLEHLAFATLLLTGYWMASSYGVLQTAWLSQKLSIIWLVIIPLELADIFLGNWIAAEASRRHHAGEPVQPWKLKGLAFYHGRFTQLALQVIPPPVLLVMYMAIAQMPLSL